MEYAQGNKRSAYRVLSRVLHLLEDMTSPAHVHADPHGWKQDGWFEVGCEGDTDDFERSGYCKEESEKHKGPNFGQKVLEYFAFQVEPNIEPDRFNIRTFAEPKIQALCDGVYPPPGITCRSWRALSRIYGGRPQASRISSTRWCVKSGRATSAMRTFVMWRRSSTSSRPFGSSRRIRPTGTDVQPRSEPQLMPRGSTASDCDDSRSYNGLVEGSAAD